MEVSLFDKTGSPKAYIAEDKTIYLWNGRPVAYLSENHIYGFNGTHLGWFEQDIVYDNNGYRIGFTRTKCPSVTHVEPVKSVKNVKYVKSVQYVAPVKPVFSLNNSSQDFEQFLSKSY